MENKTSNTARPNPVQRVAQKVVDIVKPDAEPKSEASKDQAPAINAKKGYALAKNAQGKWELSMPRYKGSKDINTMYFETEKQADEVIKMLGLDK